MPCGFTPRTYPFVTPCVSNDRQQRLGIRQSGICFSGGPYNAHLTFNIEASWREVKTPGEKKIGICGGPELFVRIEAVPEADLPLRVEGSSTISCQQQGTVSIYL